MAAPTGPPMALPSLNALNEDKIKREMSGYGQRPPTTISMPDLPLISPTSTYSGPPPPYSYPSSGASSAVGYSNGVQGGPLSSQFSSSQQSQTSRADKEAPYPALRPSLPSLNEALSIKSILNANAPPAPPASVRSPTSPIYRNPVEAASHRQPQDPLPSSSQQTPHTESAYDANRRGNYTPLPIDHQHTPRASNPYHSFPSSHAPRQPSSPPSFSRPGAAVLQQRIPQSPYFNNGHTTTQAEPTSTAPYGHQTYQPAYSYPPTTPSVTTFHTPLLEQPPWRSGNIDLDRAEEIRKAAPRESPPNKQRYGESVKRQLDIFDLETSLCEIAQGAGSCLEFSRHFGVQNHHNQRSGLSSDALPTLVECDEMIHEQTRVMESMTRLREVIVRQQQALLEQKSYDQQNHKLPPMSEPEDDGLSYQDKIEGGGGFAGPDSKKRRGRAAPPGRCHSCNRAETPEWRRGPDGARTLCNACGLHYAKLTRKLGNKTGAGSSNLRPKDSSPSSP